MVYRIIQWWATLFLRLYFRKTIVYGVEHIPKTGPLIVASNHPSAFLEASLLGTIIRRPLHYLVRGDVFHPKFRWLFDVTNQIPIYRQKDGMSNLRKNASSFDLTYQKLSEGHAVLIFPEAKTILEKKMRPIQRGTAHLAFGTIPYLKEEQELLVLPVGVNFTEPRLPGTDVVVRFGKPFITQIATREDRDAIEQFTSTLSEAMEPLIIQVQDHGYEHHYDILASIYMRFIRSVRPDDAVHTDLVKIADAVNHAESPSAMIGHVHEYWQVLRQAGLHDGRYFPEVLTKNRIFILGMLIFKSIWLIAGGWIWRLLRLFIFSKIKTITFQGPASVVAAMVVYPLFFLVWLIVCALLGWPFWFVAAWILTMWAGTWVRPSWTMMWQVFTLSPALKLKLKKNIISLQGELETTLF